MRQAPIYSSSEIDVELLRKDASTPTLVPRISFTSIPLILLYGIQELLPQVSPSESRRP